MHFPGIPQNTHCENWWQGRNLRSHFGGEEVKEVIYGTWEIGAKALSFIQTPLSLKPVREDRKPYFISFWERIRSRPFCFWREESSGTQGLSNIEAGQGQLKILLALSPSNRQKLLWLGRGQEYRSLCGRGTQKWLKAERKTDKLRKAKIKIMADILSEMV